MVSDGQIVLADEEIRHLREVATDIDHGGIVHPGWVVQGLVQPRYRRERAFHRPIGIFGEMIAEILAGAGIKNAALTTVFLANYDAAAVEMAHAVPAVWHKLQKGSQLIGQEQFGEYRQYVP